MRCIFCLEEREAAIEHVFPDAIGGVLTIDRVCKACNDWLGGNIDVLLTEHIVVQTKRNQLNLASRSGRTPTWHDMFGVAKMANDPEQRVKIVQDAQTGQIKPVLLHKEVRTTDESGNVRISVNIDADKSGEIQKIIQRTRKREGLSALSDAELREQAEAATASIRTINQPELIFTPKIDVRDYQRAICKIVYELAFLWLGDAYLDDPVAKKLRKVILAGTEEYIRGQINPSYSPCRHAFLIFFAT